MIQTLDEKAISQLDAITSQINRLIPQALFGFYSGCVEAGFSPADALHLTQYHMMALCTQWLNNTNTEQPSDDA